MDGQKYGWVITLRSNTYHYIRDFTHKRDYEAVYSLCKKKGIEVSHAKNRIFLEKFEILTNNTICSICELKLDQLNQNNSKKEILTEINNVSDGYFLRNVTCSEETCNEKGMAFVSIIDDEEKPHYCIIHNIRIQETIRKEKELVA